MSRRALAIATGAVVAVSAAAVVYYVRTDGSAPATSAYVGANQARATAWANSTIAKAVVLPGAHAAAKPPVASVTNSAIGSVQTPDKVIRKRWWTAPGTVKEAIAYFRAHEPSGWVELGSATSSGLNAVSFVEPSFGPGFSTVSGLSYSVDSFENGVAVLASVEADWDLDRSNAETIPSAVSSVDITLTRAPAAMRRATLSGSAARTLAEVVNGQPAGSAGARSCPMDRGYVDELVFHTPGRPDVDVQASVQGCGFIDVSVGGAKQPFLTGGATVDTAVRAALGLPASINR